MSEQPRIYKVNGVAVETAEMYGRLWIPLLQIQEALGFRLPTVFGRILRDAAIPPNELGNIEVFDGHNMVRVPAITPAAAAALCFHIQRDRTWSAELQGKTATLRQTLYIIRGVTPPASEPTLSEMAEVEGAGRGLRGQPA